VSLSPIQSVVTIDKNGAHLLSLAEITKESVGEKAFGLTCLPPKWTLPFVVVNCDFLAAYRSEVASRAALISSWAKLIRESISNAGIEFDAPVLIRSSAISEPIDDRGRFHSVDGTVDKIELALRQCLDRLTEDQELREAMVHLIIQRRVIPISGKGHLSNERRCYEEARDWLGEFEEPEHETVTSFPINLRKWRREVRAETELLPLACNLEPLVSRNLVNVAWWGYRKKLRLHFEWVWDGHYLYIVQVDEVHRLPGVNPTRVSTLVC
jgi:hypothetical protein